MLKGKVAIITGGTRGIGFATVKKFLDNGATVAILGSKQDTVDRAISKLKEENPDYNVVGYWPNIAKFDEVEKVYNDVKERFGSVDIVVNNAGISARASIFFTYSSGKKSTFSLARYSASALSIPQIPTATEITASI